MGDQARVQLAGEHRDAVHPGVATKPLQLRRTLRLGVLSSTTSWRQGHSEVDGSTDPPSSATGPHQRWQLDRLLFATQLSGGFCPSAGVPPIVGSE